MKNRITRPAGIKSRIRTPLVTHAELRKFKEARLTRANTIGSEWVYFRDNDPKNSDAWAGRDIKIVTVVLPGAIYRAELVKPTPSDGLYEAQRTVKYSELW